MTKLIAILASIIIVTIVSACANSHVEKATMAIGEVNVQQLLNTQKYFKQSYQTFELTADEVTEIKSWPSDLHIDVYFGTWCHDSAREVPKFMKMLSESERLSHRLIGLDFEKSEPSGSAKDHDIKYTPTFVVYRNNKEVGRIIERPKVSITADISAML